MSVFECSSVVTVQRCCFVTGHFVLIEIQLNSSIQVGLFWNVPNWSNRYQLTRVSLGTGRFGTGCVKVSLVKPGQISSEVNWYHSLVGTSTVLERVKTGALLL